MSDSPVARLNERLASLSELRGKRCLVTGGCGFVGRHIVEQLLQAGASFVRVIDLRVTEYNERVEFVQGDLTNKTDVFNAVAGCDVVFHVASPSPTHASERILMLVNVEGTKLVIEACKENKATLVCTSSASVIDDAANTSVCSNADEHTPAPKVCVGAYEKSKLKQEQLVIEAATEEQVMAAVVRPRGIFGPHDPHFFPRVIETGAKNKTRMMLGDACNLADFTFVGNVAYGHLLAANALLAGDKCVNGQVFIVTNNEPVPFWDFMARVCRGINVPRPQFNLPYGLMISIATVLETAKKVMPKFDPLFTRQIVRNAAKPHYFNIDKARKLLKYRPVFTLDEGLQLSFDAFADRIDQSRKLTGRDARAPKQSWPVSPLLLAGLLGFALLQSLFGCHSGAIKTLAVLVLLHMHRVFNPWSRSVVGEVRNLSGQTALVTGGSAGIGFETARKLLTLGARVVICARNQARCQKAARDLARLAHVSADQVISLPLDLCSMASVDELVQSLQERSIVLDAVVLNAGAMMQQRVTTADGFNSQLQTNYLGHWQLCARLLSLKGEQAVLRQTARFVHVSSVMHEFAKFDLENLDGSRCWLGGVGFYCFTKLLNIMFSNELNRRLTHTRMRSVAVHPGVANTEFVGHFIPSWLHELVSPGIDLVARSTSDCANSSVWAAASPLMHQVGGVYVDNCRVSQPAGIAKDTEACLALWKRTEAMLDLSLGDTLKNVAEEDFAA